MMMTMLMLMMMKMMKWVGEWSQVRRGKEETRDFHLAEKPPFFSLHHCEEVEEEEERERDCDDGSGMKTIDLMEKVGLESSCA